MNSARSVALFIATLLCSAALAEPLDVRKRYEEALVTKALHDTHLVIDPSPEGKIIERVDLVANDVIMPGDYGVPYQIPIVYPLLSRVTWLNHLHVRTKDYIIRNELLFTEGQRLQRDVIDESARNLRAIPTTPQAPTYTLAVARIVVCRGSLPSTVIVLVITKDNWTLRLNTDFEIDQDRLDSLSMSISESNIAGRNKTLSVNYALDPGQHTVGVGWIDPRINATRHQLQLAGDVFLGRASGALEGEYASLVAGRPLYSLRTQWGWELDLNYNKDIIRTFEGANIHLLKYNNTETIQDIYAQRLASANLLGTRSFGVLDKVNLSFGFRVTTALYTVPQQTPPISDAARAAYVADLLPRSENTSGPFVSVVAYRASYVKLQNIETFALTEDYRTGPQASFVARFIDPHFGFNSKFIELSASYGATYWGHDNLITFAFSGFARLQPGLVGDQSWIDQTFDASFHEVTPRFWIFRLHIAAACDIRRNDLMHTRDTLGSDMGLRGYEPRQFIGNDFYRVNVELRTRALNLWSVHVGAVAFYDGGDAPTSLITAGWHQDAGIGLRVLFPQFDRQVVRLDLAFPFDTVPGTGWAPRFSLGFGQAF